MATLGGFYSSSSMLQVLFLYSPPPRLRDYLAAELQDLPVELSFAAADHPLDDPELLALAAAADVLIGWKPTAELLAHAVRARLFQLPWAGVTPLLPALRDGNALRAERGLPALLLANNHGVCPATAQHAVAMLLALTNQLLPHHRWMAQGKWRKGDIDARTLPLRDDVTVGLLGYGAINQRVHELLRPFGLRCAALKRSWSKLDETRALSLELAMHASEGLHAFLRATDILVIAVPHTPETEGLLGAAELEELGSGAPATAAPDTVPGKVVTSTGEVEAGARGRAPRPLLVNIARGAVVVEAALYAALRDGILAGAALDVWYDYNPEPDADDRRFPWHDPQAHPFHELPNVLLSPHRAASPLDDLRRWQPVLDNLRRMAESEDPHSVVDLEAGY